MLRLLPSELIILKWDFACKGVEVSCCKFGSDVLFIGMNESCVEVLRFRSSGLIIFKWDFGCVWS